MCQAVAGGRRSGSSMEGGHSTGAVEDRLTVGSWVGEEERGRGLSRWREQHEQRHGGGEAWDARRQQFGAERGT